MLMFSFPSSAGLSPALLRRTFGALFATVLLLAVILSFSGSADAQQAPVLDHFKCYATPKQPQYHGPLVFLEDQFDVAAGTFQMGRVQKVNMFCNPTVKVHGTGTGSVTPITNADNHMTIYRTKYIQQPNAQQYAVTVNNQFGTQSMVVKDANILMVPTKKVSIDGVGTEHGSPSGLDHFRCYSVVQQNFGTGTTVGLQDQFDTTVKNTQIMKPHLFCNPTRKNHIRSFSNSAITEITNPTGHLTCYNLPQQKPAAKKKSVVIENQFTGEGGYTMNVTNPELLCVPTAKLQWSLYPPRDGGQES